MIQKCKLWDVALAKLLLRSHNKKAKENTRANLFDLALQCEIVNLKTIQAWWLEYYKCMWFWLCEDVNRTIITRDRVAKQIPYLTCMDTLCISFHNKSYKIKKCFLLISDRPHSYFIWFYFLNVWKRKQPFWSWYRLNTP